MTTIKMIMQRTVSKHLLFSHLQVSSMTKHHYLQSQSILMLVIAEEDEQGDMRESCYTNAGYTQQTYKLC